MKCKKGHEMVNLGNVTGFIYPTEPAQWDDVWVCDECMTKKTVRVHGTKSAPINALIYTEEED